ncbi:hypothetical protein CEXT_29521 [Caerostris extrusa]|uniref:Uncharacterized protein n=1 Tax=Caerostris extrusa TaxID=172846 RepID=A0AAV4XXW0_CAEEX|nr:hypothetical protein CEXT_29521 [Caerostris extrusa]
MRSQVFNNSFSLLQPLPCFEAFNSFQPTQGAPQENLSVGISLYADKNNCLLVHQNTLLVIEGSERQLEIWDGSFDEIPSAQQFFFFFFHLCTVLKLSTVFNQLRALQENLFAGIPLRKVCVDKNNCLLVHQNTLLVIEGPERQLEVWDGFFG